MPTYKAPRTVTGIEGGSPWLSYMGCWHSEASQLLNVPENLIIPDATTTYTPNGSSAFLKPDGRTLVSFTTTTRYQQGGPLYGDWFGQEDI
ncbi:MAG: hypothetical protein PUP91_27350 [Rhizonema sp. PD37]|nr:hypothetical protein [Rhizonema sp. PD37]